MPFFLPSAHSTPSKPLTQGYTEPGMEAAQLLGSLDPLVPEPGPASDAARPRGPSLGGNQRFQPSL